MKKIRKGSYSMGMIAIVIGIVVVVNLFVGQIPEKYRNLDISPWDVYTLTDTSKELIQKLDQDIVIYLVGEEGEIDDRIQKFIELYASNTNKIQLKYVDPVANPGMMAELETSSGSILVTCEETGRRRDIIAADMIQYTVDYTSYSYVESGFDAEGQLTSAINYVISTENPKLYYTEGHSETALATTLTDALAKNNMDYEAINLIKKGNIPIDCDILLMHEPQKDLTEDELGILQTYLAEGGKITVVFGEREVDMPNFNTLLSEYGMSLLDGYVADMDAFYQNNYFAIFPEILQVEGITSDLNSDAMVLSYYATAMEVGTPDRTSITVESFLQTTEDGYLVDGSEQTQGVYVLGANATETVTVTTEEEETKERTAQLTVFTSSALLNDGFITTGTVLENLTVFMNAITYNLENVENMNIPAKSLEVSYNIVTNSILWGSIYIAIVPVALIAIGLIVWIRRKKA